MAAGDGIFWGRTLKVTRCPTSGILISGISWIRLGGSLAHYLRVLKPVLSVTLKRVNIVCGE
jgi:hypothetical protein